ncbi:MAG: hypothetical protein QXL81_01135 [Candidatus Aenigmatarchaeota archaeon]
MKGSKGQIFVAGAAMFIVLLALISTSLSPPPSLPPVLAIAPQLENLAQEYRYAIGLSAREGSDKLDDLSAYFRDNVQGFDAIYALVSTGPEAYSLTIGNFLRNTASIRVSAKGSAPSSVSGILEDGERKSWDFSASGDVNVTIRYAVQGIEYSKSIQFSTNTNQTIGWFNIGIRVGKDYVRKSDAWSIAT